MRLFLIIVSISIICIQCGDRLNETEGYFIFGSFNGFCAADCSEVYKYENGNLYADLENHIVKFDQIMFSEDSMTDIDLSKVERLHANLPQRLKNSSEDVFGCPGCLDQDTLIIIHHDGNTSQIWLFDSIVDENPEFLQAYIAELKQLLEEI